MTGVLASFGKPFDFQVAAFRLRLGNLVPSRTWDEIAGAEHDRGFMVAGAIRADILADLGAAIDKAITQGTTLEEFRRDFRAIVAAKGWQISNAGQGTKGGEAWRTRVIYRTNMATSYAAGRMAQLVKAGFAFWVYRHGASAEPREQHLAWDGLVLEPDHPFWATHAPPNGWGCSCYIVGARSPNAAKRVGGRPEMKLPAGWQAIDKKTGVQIGIDKGWDHAPGALVAETIGVMANKAVNWDYSLAVAFMRDLPRENRDLLSTAYRALPSNVERMSRFAAAVMETPKLAPPQRTLGLTTAVDEAAIAQAVKEAPKAFANNLYEFSVDQSAVRHVINRHGNEAVEITRGQRAVMFDDFGRLSALINEPDSIEPGEGDAHPGPIVKMTKTFDNDRLVALFELRTGRRRLSLITMWVEKLVDASPAATP